LYKNIFVHVNLVKESSPRIRDLQVYSNHYLSQVPYFLGCMGNLALENGDEKAPITQHFDGALRTCKAGEVSRKAFIEQVEGDCKSNG